MDSSKPGYWSHAGGPGEGGVALRPGAAAAALTRGRGASSVMTELYAPKKAR